MYQLVQSTFFFEEMQSIAKKTDLIKAFINIYTPNNKYTEFKLGKPESSNLQDM